MLHIMQLITSDIQFYMLILLSILFIILLAWNIRLQVRVSRLMYGKDAKSLEDSFVIMRKDLNNFGTFKTELENYLKTVEKRIGQSIRGIEAINFNAFAGAESGGKSFAVAFLNSNGDGVIVSSLHTRDRVNVFTKKISNFKAEVNLSEEENLALTNAQKSCIM